MTTAQLVGGHEGLEIFRDDGIIVKRGRNVDSTSYGYPIRNVEALENEAKFLTLLAGTGFTPKLISLEIIDDWAILKQEDVGEAEPMQDGEKFRHNCIRLLWELRQYNVRHGDLTGANIIIRDDWPWVIDWQEAHFIGEPAPQKQPYPDSWLLWRTVAGTLDPKRQYDTPRVARRWMTILHSLGAMNDMGLPFADKTLLELGCFQGDFCAMAACEKMKALGVDHGGFRSGENSIKIAKRLWEYMEDLRFVQMNIREIGTFDAEVVLLFSTWSYLVQDLGRRAAEDLLGKIVGECGVLFFENQLWGDGPGPDFFQNDDDVQNLLASWGRPVEKLDSIPVWGREATRTVWRVG